MKKCKVCRKGVDIHLRCELCRILLGQDHYAGEGIETKKVLYKAGVRRWDENAGSQLVRKTNSWGKPVKICDACNKNLKKRQSHLKSIYEKKG